MGNKVNFKSGTPTDYNNTSHDDETFYHVVNDNATINHIYLGDLQLDNEDISELETDIDSLEDKFNADGQALDSVHADNADVATKLGTATVGGTAQPIYLNAGSPTAISGTVGSTTQPIYSNAGTLTAMSGALSTTYGGTGNTSGRATYSNITTTNPTSSTTYYLPWTTGISSGTNYALNGNNGIRYNCLEGTADALGYGRIYLGNNTASGTAANKYGAALIYSTQTNYWLLSGNKSISSNYTLYMPSSTGCLVVATNNSAVGSSTQPVYINSSGVATAMSGPLDIAYGGTGNTTGAAASITTTEDTSSTLYPLGVTSSDPNVLKRDTSISIANGRIQGTYDGDPLWKAENNGSSGQCGIYVQSDWANDGAGREISLQIGSGGSNRGVYDNGGGAWIVYKDSSDAVHLGTSTVGSGTKPIYLSSGAPTASSSTVGSASRPVYLNSGTITAMSGTLSTTYGGTGNSTGTATYCTTTSSSSSMYAVGVADDGGSTLRSDSYLQFSGGAIELRGRSSVPQAYIDFHYNGSSSDYTHRIIAESSSGNLIAYPGISSGSDERLKHDIIDMPDMYLDLFDKLQLKQYRLNNGDGLRIGLIAQDIIKAEEDLNIDESVIVSGTGDEISDEFIDYYAIDYDAILMITVGVIKQQQKIIDELEERVTKLEH